MEGGGWRQSPRSGWAGTAAGGLVVAVIVLVLNLAVRDTLPATQHAVVLVTDAADEGEAALVVAAWPAAVSGSGAPLPAASHPQPPPLPLVAAPAVSDAVVVVARLVRLPSFTAPDPAPLAAALAVARSVVPFDDRYATPIYTYIAPTSAAEAEAVDAAAMRLRGFLADSEFEDKGYWTLPLPAAAPGTAAWLAANPLASGVCAGGDASVAGVVFSWEFLAVGAAAPQGLPDTHATLTFACRAYVSSMAAAWPAFGPGAKALAWRSAGTAAVRASNANQTTACLPATAFVALVGAGSASPLGLLGASADGASCAAELAPLLNMSSGAGMDGISLPAPLTAAHVSLQGIAARGYQAAASYVNSTGSIAPHVPSLAELREVASTVCALPATTYRERLEPDFALANTPLCFVLEWTALPGALFRPPNPSTWTTAHWGRLAHDSITIVAALLGIASCMVAFWQCSLWHKRLARAHAETGTDAESIGLVPSAIATSTYNTAS
ncbi:uncharacterized protein AMSG_05693 [Thecamonas trahens ATCC 50062]|uniref:Uncharacterized protein n=1 Tax=Thecamonas trahens ATCC 50062 TaxID=461836 RepID=A0A0L0DE98_THETB|nr:hypothetical protein AMSG_05693 [Thecamonas trahens ATCC 50062]KNC49643.1 hypothetical protein AMSG_05693 [Thecamonas trahens ATCC 50062]|eukprot:XP_013757745.1 hypothetical protein AMSG_05693 [Thecamonas trahens ATCC 50062]